MLVKLWEEGVIHAESPPLVTPNRPPSAEDFTPNRPPSSRRIAPPLNR